MPSNFTGHLPSFFRSSVDNDGRLSLPAGSPPRDPPVAESTFNRTDLTTYFYETSLGLLSLTWSRSFLGHSLHFKINPSLNKSSPDDSPASSSTAVPGVTSFHLHHKSFNFWKKVGSKKLPIPRSDSSSPSPAEPRLRLYWDLSRANFGSIGPEPTSNFFIAAVVEHELILVVGDLVKQAISKTKPMRKPYLRDQLLVLRREHVHGNKVYKTRAKIGGRIKEITIDCSLSSDARLCFNVGEERVLLVKRLKWKFRGNEKVAIDGTPVNISWDVYNWLFADNGSDGRAVFMFKFEKSEVEEDPTAIEEEDEKQRHRSSSKLCRWGINGDRSSSLSSISVSSASSSIGGSSIMEWSSVEENELLSPIGFTLMVYAWRK